MKNSPQKKQPPQTIRRTTQGIIYHGPVPPPAIMERLEQIVPGAADRIIAMAEKDQTASHEAAQHAHERAAQIEADEHRENMTALWMAFTICFIFSIGGVALVLHGFEKIGAALICTTLLGVVSSFLSRKKRHRD
ncbi:DUF2335 domain-containing protein [Desulfovibrio sp. ZJ369]|uniref:DUF2335 domain-containing protein n=1 Tax=Desulfovibrio sp. ZJ369 TaxID=2709793 RepID=UPI00198019B3|nr:DUF2335 domain-containing protein [Desulfovibrio sp. ZJ369]